MLSQQPSPLEQKLCDAANSAVQKGKDYASMITGAINYYQTIITGYILEKRGIILFSKRGRKLKKQATRKELDKKRAEKKGRMENPSGGSKYARKHG